MQQKDYKLIPQIFSKSKMNWLVCTIIILILLYDVLESGKHSFNKS
jgi:hypothetical protein